MHNHNQSTGNGPIRAQHELFNPSNQSAMSNNLGAKPFQKRGFNSSQTFSNNYQGGFAGAPFYPQFQQQFGTPTLNPSMQQPLNPYSSPNSRAGNSF